MTTGWTEREHEAYGIPFPPLAERFERLEETLQIAHRMWSGDARPFEGKHYRLAEPINSPPAVSRPHPPILVGGTGLYIRTLLDGIAPVPEIDPAVRQAVRSFTVAHNYESLEREDPPAAARLRPSDTSRVARALEVVRSTGRPLADWQKERVGGIGGEVAALIAEHAFEHLDGPIMRLAGPDVPAMPFAATLEDAFMPSTEKIAAKLKELVEY